MLDVDAAGEAFERAVAAVASQADVVEVAGPDAAGYLQGQLSQDVESLAVGAARPAFLLQPQGKVDAWFRVTRVAPDRFWIDVEPGFGAAVLARLQRFKLRVNLELALRPALPLVAVRGPGAAAGPEALGFRPSAEQVVAPWAAGAARGGGPGFDVIGPGAAVPAGLAEAPPEALEALRIGLGLPAMGQELDDSTIPAATGVVGMSVSFTKGCYVGQELVARVDSRGANTPTRLWGLRLDRPADVALGADVVAGADVVGHLTSYASRSPRGPVALAYLKRSFAAPSPAAMADRSGQVVGVEVVALPFP